jgi:hypothetical protein
MFDPKPTIERVGVPFAPETEGSGIASHVEFAVGFKTRYVLRPGLAKT